MFKAINEHTGEVRQFSYLRPFADERANGWTASEDIDRAADALKAVQENGQQPALHLAGEDSSARTKGSNLSRLGTRKAE